MKNRFQSVMPLRPQKVWFIVSILLVLSAVGVAQSRGSWAALPSGGLGNTPGMSAPTQGARIGSRHNRARFPRHFRYPSYGAAVPILYGDYFGYDYAPEPTPPVVVNNVIPEQRAEQPSPAANVPPAVPVMIELEGDRWVRRQPETLPVRQSVRAHPARHRQGEETEPGVAKKLPPTTLVLLNGSRIEIKSYMIYRGMISYSEPAWGPRHEVTLSQLNIPATIQTNRQNGVNFELPASGSEIMMRP